MKARVAVAVVLTVLEVVETGDTRGVVAWKGAATAATGAMAAMGTMGAAVSVEKVAGVEVQSTEELSRRTRCCRSSPRQRSSSHTAQARAPRTPPPPVQTSSE